MKLFRKSVVIVALAVIMSFMVQTNVNAGQKNTTESLVWEKKYNVVCADEYYQYKLSLQKLGRVNFAVNVDSQNSGSAPHIEVYNSSGERVWAKWLYEGQDNYSVDLLAGEYMVRVDNNGVLAILKASFVPSFAASGESVNEFYMNKNNQLETATAYSIGQSVKAHFAENDDTDIYKVKVSKSGYLNMSFYSEVASLNMTISCPDKNITYKEYDIPLGTSSYKYFAPEGTYYITFTKDGYNGAYTFSSKFSGVTVSNVKSVKNLKGKVAKVTWVKKSDVDGYEVQVATNKKFTKNRKSITLSGSSANNYTFKKLKKGKTYYARVRTYVIANGKKYYSDWSLAKKVKIKK